MVRAALAILLLIAANSACFAEMCNRTGRYHLSGDGEYPMHISAKAGKTCEATFGSYGTGNLTFKRLLLVSSPQRGTIKLREGGYYIYTAPASAGADSFTLRVCGSENNTPGCATLKYAVVVN